ncbi:MAG TPA: alanyl-tRNA editing protein [Anaerolineales bacterium]|nr:alanyl-tRNA editing protein [Anaerolineales bacterium]
MTEMLFHTDSYLREFSATAIEVRGAEILVDRTAFYPGGGGQPADEGNLAWDGGGSRLVAIRKEGGNLWHAVEGTPPAAGTTVRGMLDWDRRFQLMRTHTAMHILCGVIFRQYGASVTGGQMEPLRGRMDFEFASMHQELVREIEGLINREVKAARRVHARILPRDEAFRIPDLIRTKINLLPPGIQEVRVVEIEGLDLQADGGTHVANTRDVGPMKIVDYKSKGAINKRLVVGLEA